jgi:uncharacterized membrane protein (UPF0127 family)
MAGLMFTDGKSAYNYNRYVPGSGVGGQNISVRRHLKRFAAASSSASLSSSPSLSLPTIQLRSGEHWIIAEVASTKETRARGLMFRQQLAPNHGMLFILPTPDKYCFWMKNTPLPLTVAFLHDNGIISTLADMQSYSETKHCARESVRYALEMEQGWFLKRGIKEGDRITNASLFGPAYARTANVCVI